MSILFVMIPLAMLLLAAAIWAFFWAVRSGQFDDLEAQGMLVLFDDEPPTRKSGPGTGPSSMDSTGAGSRISGHEAATMRPGGGRLHVSTLGETR
jgi:cbb3-type cytochrome oxidase maturation protein